MGARCAELSLGTSSGAGIASVSPGRRGEATGRRTPVTLPQQSGCMSERRIYAFFVNVMDTGCRHGAPGSGLRALEWLAAAASTVANSSTRRSRLVQAIVVPDYRL